MKNVRSEITVKMWMNGTNPSDYARDKDISIGLLSRVITGHLRHKAIEILLKKDGYEKELFQVQRKMKSNGK